MAERALCLSPSPALLVSGVVYVALWAVARVLWTLLFFGGGRR
jgi:hypothetical protein